MRSETKGRSKREQVELVVSARPIGSMGVDGGQ